MSEREEYKALRDEVIHLFNRIYVVLGAVFGASALLAARILNVAQDEPASGTLLLAVLNDGLLTAAILVTVKLYDHVYRIGSYLVVYHEASPGWHQRNRRITRLHATWRIVDLREAQVVAIVYGFLSCVAVHLTAKAVPWPPFRGNAFWRMIPYVLIGGYFVNLLMVLVKVYDVRSVEWEGRWKRWQAAEADGKAYQPQPDAGDFGRVAFNAFWGLAVAILFLYGLMERHEVEPPNNEMQRTKPAQAMELRR